MALRRFDTACGVSALIVACTFYCAPSRAQTPAPFSWTGLYLGTHIGNASVSNHWKDNDGTLGTADPFPASFTGGGSVTGVQFGYNHQNGNIVLGIEAEAGIAKIDGAARCALGIYNCDAKIDSLGTIAARFGYAHDRFLIYGKAGAAWAHEKFEMMPSPAVGATPVYNGKQLRWGWVLGVGGEYAITPSTSIKVEYNYLSLGDGSAVVTDQFGDRSNLIVGQEAHLVKVGLNYKLDGKSWPWSAQADAPARPSWNWNGVYVGVQTGGGWGTTDWKTATGILATASTSIFPGSGTMDGMLGGGVVGFNRHVGSWVLGAEVDANWANLDGYARCATTEAPAASFICHSHIDSLGTITGRLGDTYGNFLIYGKFGAAWAHETHHAYRNNGTNDFTGSSTRWGYAAGSGIEYAFTPAWSGKVEYNYLDFGSRKLPLIDANGNASTVEIGQQLHLVKLGLNYKLGVSPSSDTQQAFADRTQRPSDWVMDTGLRYWFSNGKSQQDLYSNHPATQVNSRLIYGDMNGHAAETFARLDHRNGIFIKGNFGLGTLSNGRLIDEDMPPATDPYSATSSPMHDGGLRYGGLDVGYNVLNGPGGKLGPYAGYRHFYQRGRGYGCDQIATSTICAPGVASGVLVLTETETWRGVAVGLNGQLVLNDRWKIEVDAAFLPYVDRAGVDNHWLRADINPGPETGHGWGTQFEALTSYAVTDRLSVGVGGRYWFFTTTNGASQFPASSVPAPLKFVSDRYGGFLQASYKIGPVDRIPRTSSADLRPRDWTGLYAGVHLGAGVARSQWSDPFPAGPIGDRVKMGGALGGGQLGFNYQTGKLVLGTEISGSWGRIEGTETCFSGNPDQSQAGLNCENKINALGTWTGRIGFAADQSLIYGQAGLAIAQQDYMLNSMAIPGGGLSSRSANNSGWTVGGGIEHALNAQWSVNVDYKYVDLGTRTIAFTVPGPVAAVASEPVSTHLHFVSLGLNRRFDWFGATGN